jgi:hypothetical protein
MQIPQDPLRVRPCPALGHQQFVASEIEPGIKSCSVICILARIIQ